MIQYLIFWLTYANIVDRITIVYSISIYNLHLKAENILLRGGNKPEWFGAHHLVVGIVLIHNYLQNIVTNTHLPSIVRC